ncbi:MAG: transporter substrate-binding protein [Herbinix sp.]|nr:transporter substrate-binding protein [Herbinix sp.]
MKKNVWKKMIAVLLILAMAIPFTACGKDKTEPTGDSDTNGVTPGGDETDPGEEVVDDDASPFAKYIKDEVVEDLDGYTFKVIDFHDDRWAPEEIKSPMDELVVSIIEDVETKYNCDIVFEHGSPDLLFENAQPEIMSGGKYADLIGTTMWEFGKMLGGNLLGDVKTIDSLDLNQPYFSQEVALSATFGNKTYAFGAPFGTHMGNYWLVFYNSRIWNELGLPDPYELVRNGEWTWDKLVEYAKLALRDNDGDGVISSDADRWGVTCPSGDLIQSFFFGMGGKYYTANDTGSVRLACIDPVSAEKINFMYKFYQKDGILFKNQNVGYLEMFAAGKALFMPYGNDANDTLKNMEDDFGILPTPKWNKEQPEYINAPDHNAPVFCITNTNPNLHEVGIIINALAKRYQAVEDQKLQDFVDTFWRFEEDEEMMRDYILGHGAYDIVNMIKTANPNFETPAGALFNGCFNNSYSDIVSQIASMEDALNVLLDDFFSNLSEE